MSTDDMALQSALSVDFVFDRLGRAKVTTAPLEDEPTTTFLPSGVLEHILDKESIFQILSDPRFEIAPYQLSRTVDLVERECRKLLAIVWELQCQRNLQHLLQSEIVDSRLPLSLEEIKPILTTCYVAFEALQWQYMPFEFRPRDWYANIRPEKIVPFIAQQEVGGGGSSTVWKVLIHPSLQNLREEKIDYFARKRIDIGTKPYFSQFTREAELLFFLRSVQHPNIVEILAAFTQNSFLNLIFPFYPLDLHNFLTSPTRPAGFEDDTVIFTALHGIASGLAHLHHFQPAMSSPSLGGAAFKGYHHDIKPRNILVGPSTFILSDFGLAQLKSPEDDSQTPWKNSTFEYGAPECRNLVTFASGKVGRALDIWSLACVISEVLVYVTAGRLGVSDFRECRIMEQLYGKTRCFHDGKRMSASVAQFINNSVSQLHPSMVKGFDVLFQMFEEVPGDRPDIEHVVKCFALLAIESHTLDICELLDASFKSQTFENSPVLLLLSKIERYRLQAWLITCELGVNSQNRSLSKGVIFDKTALLTTILDKLKNTRNRVVSEVRVMAEGALSVQIEIVRHLNDELTRLTPLEMRASLGEAFVILASMNTTAAAVYDPFEGKPRDSDQGNTILLPLLSQLSEALLDKPPGQPQVIRSTSAIKRLSILFEEAKLVSDSTPLEMGKDIQELAEDERKDPRNNNVYVCGAANKTRVLIEWQEYELPEETLDKEAEELVLQSLFDRILALAALLGCCDQPKELRILRCLGAMHDRLNSRFGLLYSFPPSTSFRISLHELYRRGQSCIKLANLSEKLRLARAVTQAIQYFHLCGWVHKTLSSPNILFFYDETTKDVDLAQPYVGGFRRSRPDTAGAASGGMAEQSDDHEYLHPDYRLGQRFKRSFDYYALGLLLLEIGLWTPLVRIYGAPKMRGKTPYELREEYMTWCQRDLVLLMGEKYAGITWGLISVDSWDGKTDTQLSLTYQHDVVNALRQLNF